MSILSSPFLTLSVIDTALKSATDPNERVRLLSARVHLLQAKSAPPSSSQPQPSTTRDTVQDDTETTTPSTSRTSDPPADRTSLLLARLALADAYFALPIPDLHAASGEAMAVEAECKRLNKASKRWEEPPGWLNNLKPLRRRALLLLADIEDGLGRPARGDRNRALANEL